MKFVHAYRQNARDCLALASETDNSDLAERYVRMSDAWILLATEQEWIDALTGHAKEVPEIPDATLD